MDYAEESLKVREPKAMKHGICALCRKEADLLDSHYLPKRTYSMNMARSLKNPNPVTLAHRKAKQISDQLRGYAFCAECEDLFNRNGERWVLANIPRDQGSPFPLQDALFPEIPTFIGENINVYAGRKIKAFDIEKLVYFGMSVFWRGAAREWKSSTGAVAPPVDLREYFEPIREFLRGRQFPDDVFIIITISNLKPPGNAALPALQGTAQFGDFYWFYINGVGFMLYLGREMPPAIRNLCAHHNPDGPVAVDKGFNDLVYGYIKKQLHSSEKSQSLMTFLEGYKADKQA
ncbi:MAG: hypothetical protein ACYCOR_07550 [Acidobacteriaceae bacterium]